MAILVLKLLHVLGSTLFLGTGLGSAYYKMRAFASRDVRVIAWMDAEVVRADWLFTVPAGLLMPLTGFWMLHIYAIPWSRGWPAWGLLGYVVAGLTWLPAAWLQVKMKRLSAQACDLQQPLPASYAALQRAWALLGLPSFSATLFVFWVMVGKRGL
jgi:uncharacterized membrane protein